MDSFRAPLDIESERALVQLCCEFESQWRKNGIRAEDFLARREHTADRELLQELLRSERDLRNRFGPALDASELAARFGDCPDLLEAVFGESFGLSAVRAKSSFVGRALGDFRLLREIGRGGMGVVYEAEQVSLRRRVALKLLPESVFVTEIKRRRFEREARAAASLHHTNIVPVHAVGEDAGTPYYVMQLIRGCGLDQVLRELRGLADAGTFVRHESLLSDGYSSTLATVRRLIGQEEEAPRAADPRSHWHFVARVGQQTAAALHFAHERGILHRDVKPANLMLDGLGNAWLTDFGLAKLDDTDLTQQGDVVGTMRYMAPEALEGKYDARSDVYALGLTLHEALTLVPAFPEADRSQLLYRISHGELTALRTALPDIPLDLATVIAKATEREPQQRYQTAGELADDLDCWLRDEPIQARRISTWERIGRWARRHREIAGLSLVVVGLLFLSAIGFALAAMHFRRLESEQRHLAATNQELATDNESKRRQAVSALQESKETLSDMYRSFGLQAQEEQAFHLAALWFSEASRVAEFDGPRRSENATRALNALRFCPLPKAIFTNPEHVPWDDLHFHPSGDWLIATSLEAKHVPLLLNVAAGAVSDLETRYDDVSALAWDAAGERLAVATGDGHVDIVSFPHLRPLQSAHTTGRIRRLAFHPQGQVLAAATNTELRLWQLPDLRQMAVEAAVRGTIRTLSFSPDGDSCIVTSDQELLAWPASEAVGRLPFRHPWCLSSYHWVATQPQFDREGRLVFWSDKKLLWADLRAGAIVREDDQVSTHYCLEVSPFHDQIAVASDDGIWLYDEQGKRRFNHTVQLAGCWLPTGHLLTGHRGGQPLSVLDLRAGSLRPWTLFQPDGFLRLRLSPNHLLLATISGDRQIRIWELPRPLPQPIRIPGSDATDRGYVSPNSQFILVSRADQHAQVYRLQEGTPAGPELVPEGTLLESQWMPASDAIATLSRISPTQARPAEAVVDVWDWRTGQRRQDSRRLPGNPCGSRGSPYDFFAIDPTGQRVAFSVADERGSHVVLADLAPGGKTYEVNGRTSWLQNIPQFNQFATFAGDPCEVFLVNWSDATIKHRIKIGEQGRVLLACLSQDGRTLAIGDSNSLLNLLDVETGKRRRDPIPHPNWTWAMSFTSDGSRILTKCKDEHLRLWSCDAGHLSAPVISTASPTIATVAAADRSIVSIRSDGICSIYSTIDGRLLFPEFQAEFAGRYHDAGGSYLVSASDGRHIVVGGAPFIQVLDVNQYLPSASGLPEQLVQWCEIVSGHRIQSATPTGMTAQEWLGRWLARPPRP